MFDTPLGAVVVFVMLAVGTWVAVRLAGRRRNRSLRRMPEPAKGPATPDSV
jgi:hypothetical protein